MSFDFTIDHGYQKRSAPKFSRVQFGDGYMSRQRHGINTDLKIWTVSFVHRDDTETAAIEAYFEERGGVDAFPWTPPDSDTEGSYICTSWDTVKDHANDNTITATFEETQEP